MRYPWRGLVLAALLVTLGGCLIESDQLPGDPAAAPDPRLSGAWYQKSGAEMNVFVFGRSPHDGALVPVVDWIVVRLTPRQHVRQMRYRFWTFKAGGLDMVSVEAIGPLPQGMPRRTFAAYRIDGSNRLWIALPSFRPVREAVEKGELAGRAARDKVHLTADGQAIADFLARRGAQVFRFEDIDPLVPVPATGR